MQSGSPIFLYSGSLETQYWRGFARVGCAKLKMFALLDCSELPLRPEPGRPWTTSPSPWTAGTAASGCTLTAHRLGRVAHRRPTRGARPPNPPAVPRHGPAFEISPEARKPPGARRRAWTTASGCPPPPPAHPCPEPLRLGDPRQQGPGARRRARGRSPGGPGGVPPHAKERPRRGPEAGGAVFIRPPWGGLILVSRACAADAYRR